MTVLKRLLKTLILFPIFVTVLLIGTTVLVLTLPHAIWQGFKNVDS